MVNGSSLECSVPGKPAAPSRKSNNYWVFQSSNLQIVGLSVFHTYFNLREGKARERTHISATCNLSEQRGVPIEFLMAMHHDYHLLLNHLFVQLWETSLPFQQPDSTRILRIIYHTVDATPNHPTTIWTIYYKTSDSKNSYHPNYTFWSFNIAMDNGWTSHFFLCFT